uniref:Uncharacterized protein n=1 Tax=Octactis speculum TaxID=3111310 RepID=A0A7S2MHU1_9STRA|mmetsp:Transcript_62617/g.86067  ORF Transcript_62617/g.86067 Transcript_62617/m.86067 type:complete len:116 (+) Transcript_62617:106-453(+)|eukprot:CAMPEP_0185746358 /NCGR_PEP_ID=MMETSP1174-20130828/4896_1 /TAXON_ID=35687 /ORGANISM="Dictyocha speculum, Strain CCMP1381" /LENGTH=115 /DNA_ID=CAMNT_0028420983 /DNA_START=93 /DNA_END=440 /DNA_ORIENTATION=+
MDGNVAKVMETLSEISENAMKAILTEDQQRELEAHVTSIPDGTDDSERARMSADFAQQLLRSLPYEQKQALVHKNLELATMAVQNGLPEAVVPILMTSLAAQLDGQDEASTDVAR